MMYAIDIETECVVEGCRHFGKSMCAEGHSLSPWHSRISVIGVAYGLGRTDGYGRDRVFRGPRMMQEFNHWLKLTAPEPGAAMTAHSGKFDVLHLIKHGADKTRLLDFWKHDSHLLAFVWTEKISEEYLDHYNANRPPHQRAAGPHSLKTLAPYFLNVKPYWEVAEHNDDEYVLTDTRHTHALTKYLIENMPQEQREFVDEKLLPWTKLLVEAELEGLKLDVEGLLQYKIELETIERQLRAALDDKWASAHAAYANILRADVNRRFANQKQRKDTEARRISAIAKVADKVSFDSPTQMSWLLSEFYGYDITSLDGTSSTGKEVLQRLSSEGHEDVSLYLKWRKTQKILSAFIPSLLELKDANDYLHPVFNPTGARTGRLSCERPNAQQIPKELKGFFSPGEGRMLLGYDAKAIEAKLIAAYTEDENFCKIVLSGDSFHDFNAKAFFDLDCPVNEVAKKFPKERRAAKTIGFACIFGAGANRIRIAMNQAGFNITQSEAKRIYKKYRETYAGAFDYTEQVVAEFEQGNVVTNMLGRPLRVPNPQDAFMRGMNLVVQSSASDLNLDRALALCTELRSRGVDARPHLFIHDYIGISVPTSAAKSSDQLALNDILPSVCIPTKYGTIKIDYEGGVSGTWE